MAYGHEDLHKYDHLPAIDAIIKAWTDGGPSPRWHGLAVRDVHTALPLLARAVDRLVATKIVEADEIVRREYAQAHKDDFDIESAVAITPWSGPKIEPAPNEQFSSTTDTVNG